MSLNKFTDTQKGLDLGLKIGCDELECKNPPWIHGGDNGVKLVAGQTYSALDVSDKNHIYINEGGLAVLNSLSGGTDGQVVHITVGGYGGSLEIKENTSTGAPGEQPFKTSTGSDITVPQPPQSIISMGICQYVASQDRWIVKVFA